MDWFVYDINLHHGRGKQIHTITLKTEEPNQVF